MYQHVLNFRQVPRSNSTMSVFALPILASAYAVVAAPLFEFFSHSPALGGTMEARYDSRIFWPMLAATSVVSIFLTSPSRVRFTLPPHIFCLVLYLGLAGASTFWAFSPETSFTRFMQQIMIVTSIIVPALITIRSLDMMRGLFAWFAFACVLNVIFIFASPVVMVNGAYAQGLHGYMSGKNALGQCAAVALLLSLHEMLHRGWRRVGGVIIGVTSLTLIVMCESKTSFGLAILVPFLAAIILTVYKVARLSPAILPVTIVCCYLALSTITNININRVSYILYGDWTWTGRTAIWDFLFYEIRRKPVLGWGYQSFWLAGPGAPSIVDAPGWVKSMPNGHNGYYDTIVETGYIGLMLLLAFVSLTLHAIGRVADKDLKRAWVLLSLSILVIIYNGLESIWMRGFEFLWVVFLIVAADAARYWKSSRRVRVAPLVQRHSPIRQERGIGAGRI